MKFQLESLTQSRVPSLEKVENTYPGATATAAQMLSLADEYRKASQHLISHSQHGKPISRSPRRFLAAHAIELYLNALLLHTGHKPTAIRGLQHDFSARAEQAIEKGLKLRKKTALHLLSMTSDREHLITRYSADVPPTLPQINRINATLDELAEKVAAMIGAPRNNATPPRV